MGKLFLIKMLFLSLLLIVSCGSDDDDNGHVVREEEEERSDDNGTGIDLFRSWRSVDGLFIFDLSGASFNNTRGKIFRLNSGELCRCTLLVNGNQTSGKIRVSSCSYAGGGFGDPDCAEVWENNGLPYTYTKSGRRLLICEAPARCRNYQSF